MGGFRLQSLWSKHVESFEHCSTVLRVFYSMPVSDFFRFYGDVPYAKSREPVDEQYRGDIEKHMAARSSILNAFHCRVSLILSSTFGGKQSNH